MAINYEDVLGQLQAAGLIVDSLRIGKLTRCKVEGDHEKRGWYSLHEITLTQGDAAIVGSYGVWQGSDNNAQKIALRAIQLTDDQKAAYRERLKADRKMAEGLRRADAQSASEKAERTWNALSVEGEHDYLTRKGVSAHGVRFAPPGTTIDYESDGKFRQVDISHSLAVPMCDPAGKVWGLQFIFSRVHHAERINRLGRDKEYWPRGMDKSGKYHWIGGLPDPCILVGEGYATCASAHEATGLPVAVAFDAGSLLPVAAALRKKYKRATLVFLADDDAFGTCPDKDCAARFALDDAPETCPACNKPHGRLNTGVDKARAAALAVGGTVVIPKFADPAARRAAWIDSARKLTDFNDAHKLDGLAAIRAQIEDALDAASIRTRATPAPASRKAELTQGGGGNQGRTPVEILPVHTLDELLQRFVVIYGEGDVVFDRSLHKLVKFKDVQNLTLSRDVYANWTASPVRQFAMLENVGFDPAGTDPMVTCNVYRGWPTVPKEGDCELLLESLWHLCSGEENAIEVYQWMLKWLAYPIQHPGAKMESAIVIHGPQGTGKSFFFKVITRIYGEYGLTINQSAIESPRNVWLASRLFVLAEEVIARKELHHVKNALKDLITGDTVYVDPKFVNPYPERNHVNLVFLSNETMPVVLENDDRRHLIIWTPDPQPDSFYARAGQEADEGGIAALHHHLATLPLDGFTPRTHPPMTRSKTDLIDLSLDSTTRFWKDLVRGELENIRVCTIALGLDLYSLYRKRCAEIGAHPAPLPKLINTLEKKHGMIVGRKRWRDGYKVNGPHGVCFIPEVRDGVPINPECPAGQSEADWIGSHVTAFRAAVKDYRETSHA